MASTDGDVDMGDDAINKSVSLAASDELEKELQLRRKAVRQVEFYFADSNLPYDKFMWSLHSASPDHWVTLATVGSFKRMRELLSSSPSTRYSSEQGMAWLTGALKELSLSLEVDEAGERVRRRTEVKEPKGAFERSVYAKGFPLTANQTEDIALQSKLEDFFNAYGSTNEVRMRRDDKKKFKGSVFVEFTEPQGVDAFLLAEPKPSWEGKDLLIMTKEEYCDMKIKEKGLTGKAANNRRELMTRRPFDAFRMMKEQNAKEGTTEEGDPNSSAELPKQIFLEFMGTKLLIHKNDAGEGTVKEEEVPFVKGATLKFIFEGDGVSGEESINWATIKNPAKDLFEGRAPFIKFSRGDSSGLVGFHKQLSEEEVNKVREAITKIGSKAVRWEGVGDSEEKQFQIDRAQTAARGVLSRIREDSVHSSRPGRWGKHGGHSGRGGRGRRGGGKGGRGPQRESFSKNGTTTPLVGTSGNGVEGDGGQVGEKRKRAVEPDGGAHVGVRGEAMEKPPTVQSLKKVKVGEGEGS